MTEPSTPNPSSAPASPPPPDLSANAERLLSTVATAAESAIVRAGAKVESRLARGLTSLADRLEAALRRTDDK